MAHFSIVGVLAAVALSAGCSSAPVVATEVANDDEMTPVRLSTQPRAPAGEIPADQISKEKIAE